MIRGLVLAAFAALISATSYTIGARTAQATETTLVTHDGVWWNAMDRTEKLAAIQGMLVGFDAGYDRAEDGIASIIAVRATSWKCGPPPCPTEPTFSAVPKATATTLDRLLSHFNESQQIILSNDLNDALSSMKPTFVDRTFGIMVDRMDQVFSTQALSKIGADKFVFCAAKSGESCKAESQLYQPR